MASPAVVSPKKVRASERRGEKRKTSRFLQRTSSNPPNPTPLERSGGIIPCIIQGCKLTLSGDIPSIKWGGWRGGSALTGCPVVGWGGRVVDVGRNAAVAGGPSEGVPSGISHPLIQQVGARQGCVACGRDPPPHPLSLPRGSKTTSGPGF